MTNLLSGRHKYLTNKNTKKGQKVRKKLSLRERPHFLPLKTGTALSLKAKAVQHPVRSRFFEMISFFLHSVSANLMIAKKRANARKTPEIVRFRGFEAMISFFGFAIWFAPPKKISWLLLKRQRCVKSSHFLSSKTGSYRSKVLRQAVLEWRRVQSKRFFSAIVCPSKRI